MPWGVSHTVRVPTPSRDECRRRRPCRRRTTCAAADPQPLGLGAIAEYRCVGNVIIGRLVRPAAPANRHLPTDPTCPRIVTTSSFVPREALNANRQYLRPRERRSGGPSFASSIPFAKAEVHSFGINLVEQVLWLTNTRTCKSLARLESKQRVSHGDDRSISSTRRVIMPGLRVADGGMTDEDRGYIRTGRCNSKIP